MLSNNPVLPNFVKTVLVTTIAAFSVSAFAGHHEEAEQKIGDLKDMTIEKSSTLTADEAKMLDAKSSMAESKAEAVSEVVTEDELAKKAESIAPEE